MSDLFPTSSWSSAGTVSVSWESGAAPQARDLVRRIGGALASGAEVAGWHAWMDMQTGSFAGTGLRDDSGPDGTDPAVVDVADSTQLWSWFVYRRLSEILGGGRLRYGHLLLPEAKDRGQLSALLEAGAPPPDRRIAALSKLHRAGYPVRVRLSPIVPLQGWEQAYRDLLDDLLRAGTPEMITLWSLSMVELDDLARIVPLDRLDPGALAEARAAAQRLRGHKGAPFPVSVRAHLYRTIARMIRDVSPGTRLALCLESPDVWREVGDAVEPRRGGTFQCNCGPRSEPGCG